MKKIFVTGANGQLGQAFYEFGNGKKVYWKRTKNHIEILKKWKELF